MVVAVVVAVAVAPTYCTSLVDLAVVVAAAGVVAAVVGPHPPYTLAVFVVAGAAAIVVSTVAVAVAVVVVLLSILFWSLCSLMAVFLPYPSNYFPFLCPWFSPSWPWVPLPLALAACCQPTPS